MDGTPDVELTASDWTFRTQGGHGTLSGPAEYDLGDGVLQNIARSSSHIVYARATDSPLADLYTVNLETGAKTRLTDWSGYEDRPAFSPDHSRIAFFSGRSGYAALYVATFTGTELSEPVQLTNINLEHRLGGPPEGFVPPPDDGIVTWTDAIRWTAGGEVIEVQP